jgi:ATP-dependent DNA ligase
MYRLFARPGRGSVLVEAQLAWYGLPYEIEDLDDLFPAIAAAVSSIGARQAHLDGELCGVGPDGITSFSMIQLASDAGNAAGLVFFLFDLLHLDGEDLMMRPLIDRKDRLAALLSRPLSPRVYSQRHGYHLA